MCTFRMVKLAPKVARPMLCVLMDSVLPIHNSVRKYGAKVSTKCVSYYIKIINQNNQSNQQAGDVEHWHFLVNVIVNDPVVTSFRLKGRRGYLFQVDKSTGHFHLNFLHPLWKIEPKCCTEHVWLCHSV